MAELETVQTSASSGPSDEPNAWWTTLQHHGVLLSPLVLEEIFPDGPPSIPEDTFVRIRKAYRRFRNNMDDSSALYDWLDLVLEEVLGYPASRWQKEQHVEDRFKLEKVRPNRVLYEEPTASEETDDADEGDPDEDDADDATPEPRLLLLIDKDRVQDKDGEPGRIGIYSGRRTHARLVEMLRETGVPLGVLTNGHQVRLVHATLDAEHWTEWDTRAWFEGGLGRVALQGLVGLLGADVLPSHAEDEEASLLGRIQESRDRQADLSDVMGTQVREAVEVLLRELDGTLMEQDGPGRAKILGPLIEVQDRKNLSDRDVLRARYQAAIRLVMRLVVALYAESRGLFPKDNPAYLDSYSVEGLFRQLREARADEGEETLEQQFGAWARLQALSRLLYHGSPHKDLTLPAYGGQLFRPPFDIDPDLEEDPILAALAVFESDQVRISDKSVLTILEKLKIARFKAGGTWRTGPVDFSDLRTEYIGMMYEGLLDYDLRRASEDDGGIVFLNLGDQPALPFNVLENLDDKGLKKMIKNLRGSTSKTAFLAEEKLSREEVEEDLDDDGDAESREDAATEDEISDLDAAFAEELGTLEDEATAYDDLKERIHDWARRVVDETGLYMPHPNSVKAMDPTAVERAKDEAAAKLIDRVVPPGGTYLVSWSGTRKATGTFYTPPGLAVPTTHRTLEPLAYECEEDDETGLRKKVAPKRPEEILDLKVCDPAMGSGTFLVAALNYLTKALKASFDHHVLPEVDPGGPIAAPLGDTARGLLNERLLSIRKEEDARWEERLEAELKRLVVERCIYGVDINPLAVELAKLSLWVETMDPRLPFTFLDHKLRVGNSLIGAWLHEFMHYPVAAWNRDGANKERDKRIRAFRNGPMKEQMKNYIKNAQHDTSWFEDRPDTEKALERARAAFEKLHTAVDEDEREHIYYEELRLDPDIRLLKHLMDRWCAVWFWPMDTEDAPILDPETFYNTLRDDDTDPVVRQLAKDKKLRFFHWELEFPDVFVGDEDDGLGFDGMLGNPPWETMEAKSLEFFTRYRPEYRTYNTQEAKKVQKALFASSPEIEIEWHNYIASFDGFKNYSKNGADSWDVPLGRGKASTQLLEQWARLRRRAAPELDGRGATPYRYQGAGRPNTYKHFAERFHFLANPNGGRLGFLCPSGIYSDYGTQDLRSLLLDGSRWEWIYSFENAEGIFDIHRSFKFCANVLTKGSITDELKCRFMVHDLDAWNREITPEHVAVTREQITRYSPENRGIVEVESQFDIEILDKIYGNSHLIKDLDIEYQQGEFNMASDSDYFLSRQKVKEEGVLIGSDGVGRIEEEIQYLPLLEGRHVDFFDYRSKAYVSGKGRTAVWDDVQWTEKYLVPQYWIDVKDLMSHPGIFEIKVGLIDVTAATNRRTIRSSVIPGFPCGHSVGLLRAGDSSIDQADFLVGVINSYAHDFVVRFKLQGLHASWYILHDLPIPDVDDGLKSDIIKLARKLREPVPQVRQSDGRIIIQEGGTSSMILDNLRERARIREELDKLVAEAYGLTDEDMRWILRPENDDPRNLWKDYKERLELLGGTGYWGELTEEVNDADD